MPHHARQEWRFARTRQRRPAPTDGIVCCLCWADGAPLQPVDLERIRRLRSGRDRLGRCVETTPPIVTPRISPPMIGFVVRVHHQFFFSRFASVVSRRSSRGYSSGRHSCSVLLSPPLTHLSLSLSPPPRRRARAVIQASGGVDLASLEFELKKRQHSGSYLIGSFSAASNVTGIVERVDEVTAMLHVYGALACWDYAAAGPHVEMCGFSLLPLSLGPGTDRPSSEHRAMASHLPPYDFRS